MIVTDYFMPNGDAEYLLTRLRATEATENIPVIVQSGRQLSEMVILKLKREIRGHAGAAHVLQKSPGPRRVVRRLAGILRVRAG